jgi:hypothetical protein
MGIRIEREIQASRDAVWKQLADLPSHPSWMKDALAIEFKTSQTDGVGTQMEVPTWVGPFRTTDLLVITEWSPGRAMSVEHEGLVSGTGRFALEGDSPTTITWVEDLRFPWWLGGAVTGWLAGPVLRHIWRKNLARFAGIVENGRNPT